MKLHIIFAVVLAIVCSSAVISVHAAEPDTLKIFDASEVSGGSLPENWEHVLPAGELVYTNYSVERSIEGRYLRARSAATSSYLELNVEDISGKGEIDVEEYSTLRWQWKADSFPEVEWEERPGEDDFTLRIELVYDFKGSALNPLNHIRKGLVTSLFGWYPPQHIISYVWAVNVPIGEAYKSPREKRTTVIPVESTEYIVNRWMTEEIDIFPHIKEAYTERKLYLKKIRIRADTENTESMTESGLKFISLIKK
jgi:hypothetical protein